MRASPQAQPCDRCGDPMSGELWSSVILAALAQKASPLQELESPQGLTLALDPASYCR